MIASVLPCLIIITAVSYFYQSFSENLGVKSAFLGMSGIISAVLLVTTFNLGRSVEDYPGFFDYYDDIILYCFLLSRHTYSFNYTVFRAFRLTFFSVIKKGGA